VDPIINAINNVLWGSSSFPFFLQAGILGILLIGAGLYFTVRLGVIQFRRFPTFFVIFAKSFKPEHADGVSPFAAFATSLAARVGAGNIAGVAIAITLGGPGAVFWMWVIALLGMATAMIEATLAQIYKRRDPEETRNTFRGGPAYYMERGLNARWMGVVFSVFLIIAFPFVFNALQANTLTDALVNGFDFNRNLIAVFIAVLTAIIIFGGVKRITKFAELVVPFMALAYLAVGLVVIALNLGELPGVLSDIVTSAFGPQEAAGGFAGYAVAAALVQGVKRGLFSNEAGLGSAPNAAAVADTKHPANQGFIQALGVFVDTIVVCSVTAFIILLSGVWEPGFSSEGVQGAVLTQDSLSAQVGDWGAQFVALALVFFSFTSIVANYYYGETTVLFLKGDHRVLIPMRIAVVGMVMFGALAAVPTVWNLADAALGLMALVNLVAILMLAKYAVPVIKDYEKQLKQGLDPAFSLHTFPELEGHVEPDVWGTLDERAEVSGAGRDPSI
jgi:AGCS family alanine or glycine:cation symporter